MEKRILRYDESKWEETPAKIVNTLQLFITNRCNLRCKACFYAHNLGRQDMTLKQYKDNVMEYKGRIKKVILLGGEPTLHPDLEEMIDFNRSLGLRTTIYTNGAQIKRLEFFDLSNVEVRIGVYGSQSSEKPLCRVPLVQFPVTIVYMLRKDNVHELAETARMSEKFNCRKFFISTIRDIADTGSYWIDNEGTVPLEDYADIIQEFVDNYAGNIQEIHISKRGVLKGKLDSNSETCRFGNIFPDGKKVICPFDISLRKYSDELSFSERKCNKDKCCLLAKIVLKRR